MTSTGSVLADRARQLTIRLLRNVSSLSASSRST